MGEYRNSIILGKVKMGLYIVGTVKQMMREERHVRFCERNKLAMMNMV